MWKWTLFNGALFWVVCYLGTKNHVNSFFLAMIFAVLHHLIGKKMIEGFDYMPDSHKTSCAAGSVPAGNGLDCKIPSDRFGL
jgi:hypothetical protein